MTFYKNFQHKNKYNSQLKKVLKVDLASNFARLKLALQNTARQNFKTC